MSMLRSPALAALVAVVGFSALHVAAEEVRLAAGGKALLQVVVGPKATEVTRQKAAVLADYLGRISGAKFEVQTGDGADADGRAGIVVGTVADFPRVRERFVGLDPAKVDPTLREDYLLESHARGVLLIGATERAVPHAVWDLLHRLGYRQYFPGPTWEIVPRKADLAIEVDAFEHPSYYGRRIWYGFGPWDYARGPYADWCEKNRCVQGIELQTGHAYDGILRRNEKAFAEHPEYLGLVSIEGTRGERKSTKFCISNPGLRKLVVDDALAQLAKDSARESVSVDPSDGGGWCQCEACARLGSVTDRAVTLANTVAEGIAERHPDAFVGMYAYNEHSPPPSIAVHPRVVISVATSFIHGGYTVDQLLEGWSQKTKILGIREYYSVSTWDRDLPGAARGGRLEYLRTTIPHFQAKGARFLSAESSDNWGPNGLGYYLAARMLWDVREAVKTPAAIDEFLRLAFGSAAEPMGRFYELLDGTHRKPLSDDLIGRMYRLLDEARRKADDPASRARLDDLVQYTRYVELWLDYSTATGPARQAAFETMLKHTYRMRRTMMIHSLAMFRDVDNRDKGVTLPENGAFSVAEGKNPLKDARPWGAGELEQIVAAGIERRKLFDFTPAAFDDDLVPAGALGLTSGKPGTAKPGTFGIYSRAPRNYYTWVEPSEIEKGPATIGLTASAGLVYQDRGSAKIDLYPAAEAEAKSVAHVEIPPTREPTAFTLKTEFAGRQRVEAVGGGAVRIDWPEGRPVTIESSFERPGELHGRWSLYFYVPKGTKIVGGFGEGVGKLLDADGSLAHTFDGKPGYFSVPVPAGHDGRLWKFDFCAGDKLLMTVPPYLARSAAELLLPKSVVEKDRVK